MSTAAFLLLPFPGCLALETVALLGIRMCDALCWQVPPAMGFNLQQALALPEVIHPSLTQSLEPGPVGRERSRAVICGSRAL